MNVSEVAEKAIDAINTYGWTQGDYGSTECGFCYLGAIEHALGVEDKEWGELTDDEKSLYSWFTDKTFGIVGSNAAYWNDRPERTKEEVIDLISKVAEECNK